MAATVKKTKAEIEADLARQMNERRIKLFKATVHPDHQAVLHPMAHHAELKSILKRGGHG